MDCAKKSRLTKEYFLLCDIYTILLIAVVPQVTQFWIPSGKAFRTHNMNPYPYFIHSELLFVCLGYGFGLIHNKDKEPFVKFGSASLSKFSWHSVKA